ncbi:MAG: tetratricopeptide repeat protein [Gallionellaceae bacterium]
MVYSSAERKAGSINATSWKTKNRGKLTLHQKGQLAQAHANYEEILKIQPKHFDALHLLGMIAYQNNNPRRALELIDKAIEICPNNALFYSNRAIVLKELKQYDAAVASYDKIIALKAGFAETYYNRGNLLKELNQLEAALVSYDKAIALKADYAKAYLNRGNALLQLKKHDAALASYDKAIAIKPDFAEAHNSRGIVLKDLKHIEAALASCDKAIALETDYAEAYWNKSLTLLLSGNLDNGWDLYEWRWQSEDFKTKPLQTNRPKWQIGDEKERLLIWAEQGVGDEVMFGALLPKSKMLSSRTLVQIDARLIPLFKRSLPEIDFFPSNIPVDEEAYDKHIPMGSLCKYLCNDLGKFKTIKPNYLLADKERTRQIRKSLCADDVQLCGISWRSKNELSGSDRSMDLKDFIGMLGKTSVRFINLQYGDVRKEISEVKENMGVEVLQCSTVDNFKDLDGLASLIDACDLVISVDNSTVHLAGALGKPTWILLPYIADWRWLLDREDSLWYPTAKLYRQEKNGDWNSVFARIKADLIKVLKSN